MQESQESQQLRELRRNIVKYSHFAAKIRKIVKVGVRVRVKVLIRFTCDSYVFALFRYFEFRVVSSGESEIVLENAVYRSIIITAWGEDSLYMLYTVFYNIPT